jgi:hypothetical protein
MADYNININAKDNASGSINKIQGGLGGLTAGAGKFKAALGAAGAALAAMGAVKVVQDQINSMDALAKSARAAGAAAGEDAFRGFQVMKQALAEAGVEGSTADRAFLNISQRMKEGAEGGKAFGGIFEKLKGSVTDANGELKSSPEILQEMINALNQGTISTDEFQKVVGGRAGPVINELFGKMNGSAEQLAATLKDVEGNTNIVGLDASENAEVFNDTIGRLKEQMGQLLTNAIQPLLPLLVELAEKALANLPAIVEKVSTAFQSLEPLLSLIGTVLTDLVFPIMSKVFEVLGNIATAIAPLVESAIPMLKAGFESITVIVEKMVGFFTKVVDGLQAIGDKAAALKEGVTGKFGEMKDGVVSATTEMTNGMKDRWNEFYMWAYGGSLVPDLVDGIISEMFRMKDGTTTATGEATAQMSNDFQNLATSINEDFAGTLENALSDGKLELNDFRGFFQQTMTKLISEALRGGNGISGAFSGLFGGGGNLLGGLFGGGGFMSGLFGGIGKIFGFADGGRPPVGRPSIVGERGPELFVPDSAGTVVPNHAMGGANVTFNINAIDTVSGTQFLLDNKQQITMMIQQAGHRRGKEIF